MSEWQVEAWLPVVGWEGKYEVSDAGSVRGVLRKVRHNSSPSQTVQPRLLKGRFGTNGYRVVTLRNGKSNRMVASVHRLVAKAFIPNPRDVPCVNHINNDRADNRVSNLEWCTQAENLAHMTRQGRRAKPTFGRVPKVLLQEIRA